VLLGQQPAFEVASIKPSPPLNPADVAAGKLHVGISIDGARVDIGFLSLADLIPIAYKLKRYQVSGPDWMPVQRFDILAKLPDGASEKQVPEMLQALLADRFKLAIHRENKERSVYALVVGKDGPMMKEAPPDPDNPPPETTESGVPIIRKGTQVSVAREGNGAVVSGGGMGKTRMTMGPNGTMRLEAERLAMAALADLLSPFVDRPVVNMTELKGQYQVALDISIQDLMAVAKSTGVAAGALQGAPGAAAGNQPATAASDPSGSSIFRAVQELGLKLDSRKAPVEQIVVDHLEKLPTEN
jgi:uncharacterized protein (TIGR03435 family)